MRQIVNDLLIKKSANWECVEYKVITLNQFLNQNMHLRKYHVGETKWCPFTNFKIFCIAGAGHPNNGSKLGLHSLITSDLPNILHTLLDCQDLLWEC